MCVQQCVLNTACSTLCVFNTVCAQHCVFNTVCAPPYHLQLAAGSAFDGLPRVDSSAGEDELA